MPNVAYLQSTFLGGEFSPLLYGRVQTDRYKEALKTCLNYIPTIQGPLVRRPGTYFVAKTKTAAEASRLVSFEFSTTQAYVLEFGDQYIRFYRNNGQITSGGSPYEISTPFLEADLFRLKFTQSADVLYITHPAYKPRKLSRTGHTAWTLEVIDFQDGPFLPVHSGDTTITPSGKSGSITLTASSTNGINGGDGFKSTDVGRLFRMKDSANSWTWMTITAFTSTTEVTATVEGPDLDTATGTKFWRMGVWSDTTGYPSCVTFHEDRLSFSGVPSYPQRVDLSRSSDYENFVPTDLDGTVRDDDGISFTLNSNQVNAVRWIVSSEKGLLVGTTQTEWLVRPSSQGEAITPSNVNAKPETRWGSADIAPVQAGQSVLFVQRAGRKVREEAYFFDSDGYRAPDLTVLAEHITAGGMAELTWQTEPQPIMWAVREDGTLLGLTYEREFDTLRAGWHRHVLGGVSDADGTQAKVESVAVIPKASGDGQELWLIVQRYVDGATVRHIEYLTPIFDDSIEQEDAYFVDCGLTYDGAATGTLSGLGHLEGETVSVLADGAVVPDKTVSSGEFALENEASVVHAGLGYSSEGQTLRIEAGSANGTALGKTRRIHRLGFLLHRTLGFEFGFSFDELTPIIFRETSDNLGEATPLFSGIKSEEAGADYSLDGEICWRQSQPVPGTVQAIMPQMKVEDRQ